MSGTRYTVRGLTFEELVKLGSSNAECRESRDVVAEVLSECLVDPKLRRDQITVFDDNTLVALVTEVLDIAINDLKATESASSSLDKGPPRDMIT